jgi:hypothetical protein
MLDDSSNHFVIELAASHPANWNVVYAFNSIIRQICLLNYLVAANFGL